MKLITFQKLGENRESPRLWIESKRLALLGFTPGTAFTVESRTAGVRLRPMFGGVNHVSKRIAAGGVRPIIDVTNRTLLRALDGCPEIKVSATHKLIEVTPSVRGFSIQRRLRLRPPFKALEVFAGGGTLSAAIAAHPDYTLVAGIEIEPKFADVWQAAHPDACLCQADVRRIHPSELPAHDVLVASIPCTSHSTLGRAKKSLAGKPELGDTGDLFLSIAEFVAHWLPLACLFENVPSFGTSLAGQSLLAHLRHLGYAITELVLDTHREWNEPQDRRRWVAVATLVPGFVVRPPGIPFTGDLSLILDPPDDADRDDAARIANSIESLRRHNARHRAQGHGFGFTTIRPDSHRVPTLVRSYHKINVGPFVETPHGLRLLRKHEAERLMGCAIDCDHYATAIEILGQGVQTRVFSGILQQLADFLKQTLPRK
jgi:DNA (cytosine-5)-methyltransferase 1